MSEVKLQVKQYVKMLFQRVLLPFIYHMAKKNKVQQGLILLADSHHEEMPESMIFFSQELEKRGYQTRKIFFRSYGLKGVKNMFYFMRSYAEAEYVILCDYFLPVASCKKRKETTVVQLWHACGLLKKCGYSTPDDIPSSYHGNLFCNYDLVTVSGEMCREKMAEAMRLPKEKVQALGVSRTDIFWQEGYQEACRKKFFELHREAQGKKIVLWAPTFRGRASHPYIVGESEIRYVVEEQLKEDYYLLSHLHPHVKKEEQRIMELLPVADLLITDYSSVLFEFFLLEKPVVIFAPDYEEYQRTRGFYLDLKELPVRWSQKEEELLWAIKQPFSQKERLAQRACREVYLSACDGHATERILDQLGLVAVRN